METVKITLSLEHFERLFKEGHINSGEYTLHDVDVKDFDYSENEEWVLAKAESTKTFKKLKEIEYNIRHNKS